jgi:hypothetical protein
VLAVPVALLAWYYGPGAGLLREAWLVLELMVVLALLHAQGAGHAGGPDEALPLGRARHDLLRIACGAAWAAAAVLVLIGLPPLVGLVTNGLEVPTKPSLAMLSALPAGFSLYAIAAAARLRGRKLLVCLMAALPILLLLAAIPAAAWLAVAAATMGLLAAPAPWAGRLRARTGERKPAALRRTAQRPLKPRGWSGPPVVGTPRRPASLPAVFGREARMAPRRIGVVALPLLYIAIVVLVRVWVDLDTASAGVVGPAPSASNVLTPLCILAFFVCRVENGIGSEYDGALPMGIATRRALRVGAGAMWLGVALLAVAAVVVACGIVGDVASLRGAVLRTWAGASGAALLAYLLVSVPMLLSVRRPGRAGLVYASVWAAVWWLTRELAPGVAALLPWTVLAAIVGPPAPAATWAPALTLWLPLAVLAVPAAAAVGARFEHKEWGRSARPARPAVGAAAGGAA